MEGWAMEIENLKAKTKDLKAKTEDRRAGQGKPGM